MKNDVLFNRDVTKQKVLLYKSIKEVIRKIDDQECSILLGTAGFHLLGWQDVFRILLLSLNDCERAYRNVVLNSVNNLNARCSFVIPIYLNTLLQLLSKEYSTDVHNSFVHFLDGKVPRRCSSTEVITGWKSTVYDRMTYDNFELINSAIEKAGSLGSVAVTNSGSGSYVQVESGCRFDVSLNSFFDDLVASKLRFEKCIIVVIEGSIIEVSEIHHLLNFAFENKRKVVLLATGYSEDVSNTLAVNWASGKLDVLPLIINQELENVNQIHDLCGVAGVIPVSSANGVLISNMDFLELPNHSVIYTNQNSQLTIQTSKQNITQIHHLRLSIQKKLENEEVEDVISILKSRLSKLSVRCSSVNIECGNDEIGVLQDRAASLFQLLGRCASQGVLEAKEIYDLSLINKTNRRRLPTLLPFSDIDNAIRRAAADAKAIDSIRAIIRMEE